MTRKITPATPEHLAQLDLAIAHMKQARMLCRTAHAPEAAKYVSRALKSVEGARRHANHRLNRSAEDNPVTSTGE